MSILLGGSLPVIIAFSAREAVPPTHTALDNEDVVHEAEKLCTRPLFYPGLLPCQLPQNQHSINVDPASPVTAFVVDHLKNDQRST
jgi:hypothetical protein